MQTTTLLEKESSGEALAFGDALRALRRAREITQEDLAERATISSRTISGLERGEGGAPRRDTLALLVRGLGLDGPERQTFEQLALRPRRAPVQRVVSEGGPRHNLPRALTSFVGRERDMSDLGPMLGNAPLLTLMGAGGIGKSRLAQELARTHAHTFADGTWFVELADVFEPSQVPATIAMALGLRDVRDVPGLSAHLRSKHVLLVLDNCEHLVGACAEVIAALLRSCPNLYVLATSRESLAIAGEIVWVVRPLDLPVSSSGHSLETLANVPSVRLLLDRARAVDSRFALTERNAAAVVRICIAADGLPLALELAAARAHMLSVQQLAERLETSMDIVSGPHRANAPRHRTMHATIDWSYRLLGSREQELLSRLAAFAGGCTLDVAEALCAGDGLGQSDILHVLAHLVDKSMVYVTTEAEQTRYRLLEPVRQYALRAPSRRCA